MSSPSAWMQAGNGLSAMTSLYGGVSARNQGDTIASALQQESSVTGQQTGVNEDAQRRKGRQFLSDQAVRIGESGSGFSSTDTKLMEQSGVEAELAALNIRYGGQIRQAGLQTQAGFAQERGRAGLIGGVLGAGADLLSSQSQLNEYNNKQRLLKQAGY